MNGQAVQDSDPTLGSDRRTSPAVSRDSPSEALHRETPVGADKVRAVLLNEVFRVSMREFRSEQSLHLAKLAQNQVVFVLTKHGRECVALVPTMLYERGIAQRVPSNSDDAGERGETGEELEKFLPVPAAEFRKNIGSYVERVAIGTDRFRVTRHESNIAVLLPWHEYESLIETWRKAASQRQLERSKGGDVLINADAVVKRIREQELTDPDDANS